MISNIRELNDADLEAITAGLDCGTARFVAQVYSTTAIALQALQSNTQYHEFLGRAQGVKMGGCGPAPQ